MPDLAIRGGFGASVPSNALILDTNLKVGRVRKDGTATPRKLKDVRIGDPDLFEKVIGLPNAIDVVSLARASDPVGHKIHAEGAGARVAAARHFGGSDVGFAQSLPAVPARGFTSTYTATLPAPRINLEQLERDMMAFGLGFSGTSYAPTGNYGGWDPNPVTASPIGTDWGGIIGGIAQGGLAAYTAHQNSKAQKSMEKILAGIQSPVLTTGPQAPYVQGQNQLAMAGAVGPIVRGAARQLPGVLAGAAGAMVGSGGGGGGNTPPRIIEQQRVTPTGRTVTDTYVRAPARKHLRVVEGRKHTHRSHHRPR